MRAAGVAEFGPADRLRIMEVPRPEPGPGELLVRVRAAGVQPVDLAVRSGRMPAGAPPVEFPVVPGNEFAGVVEETGEEVVGFRMMRCHAEYVVVPETQVVPKPEGVDWAAAGALSASGQTAHTALEHLGVRKGETLLVHGAAGGVGTMITQLAVLRGVRVVGTASAENQDHLRSLGAVPVVYGDGELDRLREAGPFDAALDAAGHGNLHTTVQLVGDRSRIGSIADWGLVRELGCRWIGSDRNRARLAELLDLVAAGDLRVTVRAAYPLEEAAKAHADVESGHGRGKVVLIVG
ncbi:NADP-dependent oxidoreductase [Herbidospora galbida]|uniref:NADP-dependent oxidoreductase n=2 Tax=Herbidospora galbida TaxID=2575442 RepID=A0A4U3MHU1_9ACTN|nr:NADP-dependent oxidoreductase [Herbidospora galbida]TKK88915.1 NADP-dependent oxidoreductase [Herbidospora galbida]